MKRLLLLSVVLFSKILPGVALAAPNPESIIPPEWKPDLSQALRDLQDTMKDTQAQQALNMQSREIADLKDAQLYVLYVRLYAHLDSKGRTALRVEQGHWLKAREKYSRSHIDDPGGSAAPLDSNEAEIDFTEKRMAELAKRLTTYERQ